MRPVRAHPNDISQPAQNIRDHTLEHSHTRGNETETLMLTMFCFHLFGIRICIQLNFAARLNVFRLFFFFAESVLLFVFFYAHFGPDKKKNSFKMDTKERSRIFIDSIEARCALLSISMCGDGCESNEKLRIDAK